MTMLRVVVLLAWAVPLAVPAAVREKTGIAYGVSPDCRLDLRLPVDETNFPTVVWFHGGGLTGGKRHFIPLKSEKIAQVAVEYRLLGRGAERGEDCIADVAAAVAWTIRHIAEYGGDSNKVFVTGMSAGAYLAMMTGMDPKWLATHGIENTQLAGIVAISGQATEHFAVRMFADDGDPQFAPKMGALAPLSHVSANLPPILCICGQPPFEWECRSEENRFLIASCVALGHANARFVELEHCDHSQAYEVGIPHLERFVVDLCPGYFSGRAVSAGGVWISGGSAAPEAPAPVLVKHFVLNKVPAAAELTLAVAGWHELRVNGRTVGTEVLSPVTCQPDRRISSVKRDIAPFLSKGTNEIEILLGNGWFNCFTKEVWGFSDASWIAEPMVRGGLVADGAWLFSTDGTWLVYDSPIVFNALRNGEWYDARKEGVRENWRAATVVKYTPYAETSPEDAAPCREFEPIAPVRSIPAGDGGTIYDFGSNRAGWCEIEVAGESGAKVTIDYDECLTPTNTLLGNVCCFVRKAKDPRSAQHDEYTLAGRPEGEHWHPRFAYHGFRYARVKTDGRVGLKSIKSVFVHSDFKSVGSFEIADSVFMRLVDATRRSYLSNFVGIPTDCPHREKNGWTGDAQLAMETGLWNFDAKAGYVHFLRMTLDSQRPDGAVPCILPWTDKFGFKWGSGPAWDAVLFEIPWQIYRFYGDDAPAREAYVAMKKYLSFIGGKSRPDGLVEYGLGDWCAPKGSKIAPLLLTDSAYVYEFNRRVAFWACRFGENDVAERCGAEAERVKAAFNKEFYKGDGVYAGGELTSLAAPLYFKGLCADGEEPKVAAELVRRVREGGHRAWFGIQGAKWVPRALSEFGYIDDAWRIFTQPNAPGWAMWMKDNDTLLESFDDTAGGTPVSHNHIMFGDLSAWAFEYLAGIKIDEPGFAKCRAEPYLPNGVDSFDISHRTTHGLVRVRAWREDGKPRFDVDIAAE